MRRVVIVEDNSAIAKYFRYLLEHDGAYSTAITESGDEAIRLVREAETVAVLVDVSLRATRYSGRYIDGIELSRIIKEDPATTHVPVIIATATSCPETASGSSGNLAQTGSSVSPSSIHTKYCRC
jgi:CheY-like chemotaxis protein